MKTIGLLGGMSWQSTQGYYQAINEAVAQRLGKLHSAKIALYSLDFAPIEQLQHQGDWEGCAKILCQAAQRVEVAGADCLLICTNTMHKLAPQVEAAISIPLLHIADATAQRIQAQGLSRIGLLGTAFTMDEAFYKGRMADKYGLDVRVPNAADRQRVHQVIYGPRRSFLAVPRSACWCRKLTARCHYLTPPRSMHRRRSSSPFHS